MSAGGLLAAKHLVFFACVTALRDHPLPPIILVLLCCLALLGAEIKKRKDSIVIHSQHDAASSFILNRLAAEGGRRHTCKQSPLTPHAEALS